MNMKIRAMVFEAKDATDAGREAARGLFKREGVAAIVRFESNEDFLGFLGELNILRESKLKAQSIASIAPQFTMWGVDATWPDGDGWRCMCVVQLISGRAVQPANGARR